MKRTNKYLSPYEKFEHKIKRCFISNSTLYKRLEGKRIALFGVSGLTYTAMCALAKAGLKVNVVLENDARWQNRDWMGVPVVSPESVAGDNDLMVISCTPYKYDKECQLKTLGFGKHQCLFIEPDKEGAIRFFHDVIGAIRALEQIKKKCAGNLLLCPYPGTGDAFYTGRYLPNLIEKLGWRDYTILVTGGSFKKVMELYGYKNCELISRETCEKLKYLLALFGEDRIGVKYLLMWGLPVQNAAKLEGMLSINDYFQYTLFGGCGEKIYRPQFSRDIERASEIMRANGLKKGKTVILFPYANSFAEELKYDWWKKLVNKLMTAGYVVATNCGPESEREIEGTVRLSLPYADLALVAELCGCMIGVRSGLFDLMSELDCKKIILYQNFLRKDRADSFKLGAIEAAGDVTEFDIDYSAEGRSRLNDAVYEALIGDRS